MRNIRRFSNLAFKVSNERIAVQFDILIFKIQGLTNT